MADDTLLQIVTSVNVEPLQEGMAEAASAVTVSTKQMESGFASAAAASETAGEKMSYSFTEARHAAAGFGEEVGIRLPRVVATFLAHTQVIGPALATAFSAVAIIGLAEVLAEIPEKFMRSREEMEKAARAQNELAISAVEVEQSIGIENLRLEDQIAKLQGMPQHSNLALALLEAQQYAERLSRSLEDDVEKSVNLLDAGFWQA